MMIKQIYLLIVTVILSSCTLLKQRSEAENTNLHRINESVIVKEKDRNSQSHVLMVKDSLQENYQVEITPTGLFSYSIKDGFKGMAGSVKVKGSKSNQLLVKKSTEASALRERSETEVKEELEQQTSKESKSFKLSINFYFYIVIAVLVVLLLLWFKVLSRV